MNRTAPACTSRITEVMGNFWMVKERLCDHRYRWQDFSAFICKLNGMTRIVRPINLVRKPAITYPASFPSGEADYLPLGRAMVAPRHGRIDYTGTASLLPYPTAHDGLSRR